MAGKTLSGFEISKGEPLTIGEEACARDLKRVISMIDEHLTEEKFTNSYTRKRKISKSAASLMALDLELSGVNGVTDAEAGASSLKAKLQAIRGAVTAHMYSTYTATRLEASDTVICASASASKSSVVIPR